MTNEKTQIDQAIKNCGEDIKYSFVMVNKRVKTKLVVENQGKLDNPQPGTVLDHGITPHGLYDFFLISQSVR